MKRFVLAAALAASAATALPAQADPPPWAPAHGRRAHDEAARGYEDRGDYGERRDYGDDRRGRVVYDSRGRYAEPRVITRSDRVWRGSDGRYYCRRSNGTTGLVLGAAAGALVGHELAGGRDRTLGTVLGAVGGGLLGREIDRGSLKCQ